MNVYLWIGSVGLLAVSLPNIVLRRLFPDIVPPFLATGWWSSWFPIYTVFIVFLFIGVGHKRAAVSSGSRSPSSEDKDAP